MIVPGTAVPVVLSEAGLLPRHPTMAESELLIRTVLYISSVVVPVMIVAGIAVRVFVADVIATANKAVTAPKEDIA